MSGKERQVQAIMHEKSHLREKTKYEYVNFLAKNNLCGVLSENANGIKNNDRARRFALAFRFLVSGFVRLQTAFEKNALESN